jgi:uncharacterized protein (DUF952 family)
MIILHLTHEKEWTEAQANGFYSVPSLAADGFIHCSTPSQVAGVAERYFAGQRGLILLVIDLERLQAEVRFEPGTDKPDELFPHVYGQINLDAVTRVLGFEPDGAGTWILSPP